MRSSAKPPSAKTAGQAAPPYGAARRRQSPITMAISAGS